MPANVSVELLQCKTHYPNDMVGKSEAGRSGAPKIDAQTGRRSIRWRSKPRGRAQPISAVMSNAVTETENGGLVYMCMTKLVWDHAK